MTSDSVLRAHLPGLLLIFALFVSIVFFLVFPPERVRRTLFFPGTTNLSLRGESRLLPRTGNLERDVALLVEDLLLGPADIDHGRLVPRDTRVRSVIVAEDAVFADLSSSAIDDDASTRIPLEGAIEAIEASIRYNFRRFERVAITIDGQVPYEPAFRDAPIGN